MQKLLRKVVSINKTWIAVALLILLVSVVAIISILDNGSPSINLEPFSTLVISATNTSTFAPSADPTKILITPEPFKSEPTIIPTPTDIPASHYLEIDAHGKYFYLGCEAAAAVDLAGYYGILLFQYNFQQELPLSDNPELGFVGDANGPWGQVPPYAYGVHAAPVAALLQKYSVDVEGGKGYTLEQMKEKLSAGHPVIVWVIGNMEGGVPAEYTDLAGNKTIVAAFEHVVILTGYDEDSVRYVNNGRFFEAPNEVFLNSWRVLGNMAVFHR